MCLTCSSSTSRSGLTRQIGRRTLALPVFVIPSDQLFLLKFHPLRPFPTGLLGHTCMGRASRGVHVVYNRLVYHSYRPLLAVSVQRVTSLPAQYYGRSVTMRLRV